MGVGTSSIAAGSVEVDSAGEMGGKGFSGAIRVMDDSSDLFVGKGMNLFPPFARDLAKQDQQNLLFVFG